MQQPAWWTPQYESRWEQVTEAWKRDWEQTKHDLGSKSARDLQQNVGDTVQQMSGKEQPVGDPKEMEGRSRFGFGAFHHYHGDFPTWNQDLENRLRSDWFQAGGSDWKSDRDLIHGGWDYAARLDVANRGT